MRNLRLQLIAAGVVAAGFGASVALACGIDFAWQLLDNRAATLDTMPVNNSFAFAVAHIAPAPKDNLHAVEPESTYGPTRRTMLAEALTQAESAGLSSDKAETLRQMRAEASGDLAYGKGALLPASVRLYTAGAVDFHKGDSNKAIARFQEILNLPANERRDREVWAAYMLGRLYGSKGEVAKASKSFALTRDFVSDGAPDPLGLAVASYGEEAKLHLDRARRLQKSKKMSAKQHELYGHEIAAAVRLYAEQASHGSTIGIDSLRDVAGEVLSDDAAVAASICDPMVQRLLVRRTINTYAFAEATPYYPGNSGDSQLSQLVLAARKCGRDRLADTDQLAAIAYRGGDYRLAERLASQAAGPLAIWVKARLAMQKGNVAEAARYYAEASKSFPSSGDAQSSDDEALQALLVGENGVLTLSRGEYVDALEQLYRYAETFWGDVAYIAERVLTVDELKTFVDTRNNKQGDLYVSLDNLPIPGEAGSGWYFNESPRSAAELRDLLARRLVRAGRYQEALKYFPPPEVVTSAPMVPPMVLPGRVPVGSSSQRNMSGGHSGVGVGLFPLGLAIPRHVRTARKVAAEGTAADYVRALNDANTARSSVDRARGWYRAAALAGDFRSGSKIMGTEGPPDSYGPGRTELRADDRFVTDGERQRFKASAPKPDLRYHYLFVGVDEAIHAADLLPPRSQAFAAVLCNATSWMTDGTFCPVSASDLRRSAVGVETPVVTSFRMANMRQTGYEPAREDLTCRLYQRYLKEGAVVAWATDFGHDCPEPDFDSAVHFVQAQTIREAGRHRQIARHRWIVLIELALVALCLSASTWWFLRHRYI